VSRWFRFYDGALDDPKVQTLPSELFKIWVNLLCVASRNGGCLPVAELAFSLRLDEHYLHEAIERLKERGLLDFVDEYHIGPHNWDKRQFKSDASNDRVKRHRERHSNAACNVTETVDATPPETETETETEGLLTQSSAREADDVSGTLPMALWNEAAPKLGLPSISHLSPQRRHTLMLRLNDLGGIEGWRAMIEILGKSPHLLGENERGWKASFDWILKPANLTKVMEGNYVRAKTNPRDTLPTRFDAIRAAIESRGEQGNSDSGEDTFGVSA
jgi:hypothetical protein